MPTPALKIDVEDPVEERIARLEINVEHIQQDVSEMKIDIRRLGDRIDAVDHKLTAKIDDVDHKLTAKIDDVEHKLTSKIDGVEQKLTAKIDGVEQKLTAKIDGVDQKLTGKIDGVDQKLTGKFDSLKDVVSALAINMERQFGELRTARALDRVWWLLMSGALLGIMARSFKWI